MMGKTHLAIGMSYGAALLTSVSTGRYTQNEYMVILAGLAIGSLLPDIDHPQSIIARKIPIVGWIADKMTSHRGFTHSLLGCIALFALGGFLTAVFQSPQIAKVFSSIITGYILHIMADLLTVRGVQLFYPLPFRIGLPLVNTGGLVERLIFGLCIIYSLSQIMTLIV